MADFYIAVKITMDVDHEGGFQKREGDRGNWTGGQVGKGILRGTKYGISAAQFPDLDIENLTVAQAEGIYLNKYWDSTYSYIKEQVIANKLFDMGVLWGRSKAVEVMQKALAASWPATVDGIMGPITLNQINNSEPVSLLLAYKTVFVTDAIETGARKPEERPAVAGWIRRINS